MSPFPRVPGATPKSLPCPYIPLSLRYIRAGQPIPKPLPAGSPRRNEILKRSGVESHDRLEHVPFSGWPPLKKSFFVPFVRHGHHLEPKPRATRPIRYDGITPSADYGHRLMSVLRWVGSIVHSPGGLGRPGVMSAI